MNKQDFLAELNTYIKSGIVTKDEVINILNTNIIQTGADTVKIVEQVKPAEKKRLSISNILYIIGGLILIIGIVTLLSNFWSDLSSLIKVGLTLGISLIFYISGTLIAGDEHSKGISKVLQIIGGALFPIGIAITISEQDLSSTFKIVVLVGISLVAYIMGILMKSEIQAKIMQVISGFLLPITIFVTLDEMGIKNIDISWIAAVAALMAFIYIVSFLLVNSVVFLFYAIAFSTWAMYSGLAYVMTQMPTVVTTNIYEYLTIAIGVCYLLLSSHIKTTVHKDLGRALDFFGSVAFFSAILKLGGYSPTQNVLWELIGVVSLCVGLYLSSISQNRLILKVTSLFIFIFIGKFTGEYFVDSFGWPIALIFGGLVLIGVGYGLVRFSNRIPKIAQI